MKEQRRLARLIRTDQTQPFAGTDREVDAGKRQPSPVVNGDVLAQQVPIPFELVVDTSNLPPNGEFSLRATIENAAGELEWTTDTVIPVDLQQIAVDLGGLVLTQVARADQDADALISEWNITTIDGAAVMPNSTPTLNFADEGTFGGNASCNSIATGYTATVDTITIDGQIATTMMACDPETINQEQAVLDVLNAMAADGATYMIDRDTLTITATSGVTLEATR